MNASHDFPRYLNENSVALLESHWSDLPQQASCDSSPEGWTIHCAGSPVFAQAGIHDEEWVAPDKLLRYADTSGQKALVERLLAILEHIKK